jgi:hypothetical protein
MIAKGLGILHRGILSVDERKVSGVGWHVANEADSSKNQLIQRG